MKESAMWARLRARLDPFGHFVRVENAIESGTPDVSYCITPGREGWMELKWAARWPVRSGPLRLKHFTPEQRRWIRKRRACGGRVWLLLRVGTEHLLLDGVTACVRFETGQSTRSILTRDAVWRATDAIDGRALARALCAG